MALIKKLVKVEYDIGFYCIVAVWLNETGDFVAHKPIGGDVRYFENLTDDNQRYMIKRTMQNLPHMIVDATHVVTETKHSHNPTGYLNRRRSSLF